MNREEHGQAVVSREDPDQAVSRRVDRGRTGRGRAAKRRIALWAGFLLSFLWLMTAFAQGGPIPCVMTGEDVGNGYEYTVSGIGSFTVNGTEGETLQAAVFDLDENCFPTLWQDGQETGFQDGIVLDPGSYELRIYSTPERDGNYGVFTFQIDNDYTEALRSAANSGQVTVEENPPLTLKYNEKEGLFRYMLPDGQYFDTNVPVGGWFRGQARLSLSDGLMAFQVRRDGELTDFSDGLMFNQPGSYEIVMKDNLLGLAGEVSYHVTIGFRLYIDRTMNLSHINAPMGLSVASVLLDGEPVESGEDFFHTEQDGQYKILFAEPGGKGFWEMNFTRDTVAPALRFDRYVDQCFLDGPVTFTSSEPMATTRILRNRQEAYASMGQIAANGVYHVEVKDQAGNMRDYDFSIQNRYSVWNKKLLVIPFAILLLGAAGFVYWRRTIKVL